MHIYNFSMSFLQKLSYSYVTKLLQLFSSYSKEIYQIFFTLVSVKIVDLNTTCPSPTPTNLVCFCGQNILLLEFWSTISQLLGKNYFFDQELFLDNMYAYAYLYQHNSISSLFTAPATCKVIFSLVHLCNSLSPQHTQPPFLHTQVCIRIFLLIMGIYHLNFPYCWISKIIINKKKEKQKNEEI